MAIAEGMDSAIIDPLDARMMAGIARGRGPDLRDRVLYGLHHRGARGKTRGMARLPAHKACPAAHFDGYTSTYRGRQRHEERSSRIAVGIVPPCHGAAVRVGEHSFRVKNLDDGAKAQATMTHAGVEEFDLHLVHRQEFDQIPHGYVNTSPPPLRLTWGNTQAQQYVGLVDNFKTQKLTANIKNADKLRSKAKRTDDENYTMLVSLQTAARIDPATRTSRRCSPTPHRTGTRRRTYLEKAKAALNGIDSKSSDAVREKQYTEAFQNANKALDVDPSNGAAQGQLNAAKTNSQRAWPGASRQSRNCSPSAITPMPVRRSPR